MIKPDRSFERARDEFIRDGIDENLVQSEYRSAKRRYRAALLDQDDWDRRAGLSGIRAEYKNIKSETHSAWKALGKVRLTSVRDAAAIMGVLASESGHLTNCLTTGRWLHS